MKIAIIGGGAAGMASAYLLHEKHAITVFEKQPILGGNIRTLNKNVTGVAVPSDIYIDNGVIEFLKDHSPNFNALMADLGVELEYVPSVSTQIFLENGRYIQANQAIQDSSTSLLDKGQRQLRRLPLIRDFLQAQKLIKQPERYFQGKSVGDIFGQGTLYRWFKMLYMYSYSIPYAQIDDLPAELAYGILHEAGTGARWNRLVGGVYTYIEKILEHFSGDVYCEVTITSITRKTDEVVIQLQNGTRFEFDAVVFATPPDQVLKLLSDATKSEQSRLGVWQSNQATTVIHTDMGMYEPYRARHFSEFDVFGKDNGRDAGYNAYLNRLSGLPDNYPLSYNLAYNLADRIDPQQILHAQEHHTPLYTKHAFSTRAEIIATNGENRTYHAGAYLGNGLHEGAIASAVKVAKLLDGKTLSR